MGTLTMRLTESQTQRESNARTSVDAILDAQGLGISPDEFVGDNAGTEPDRELIAVIEKIAAADRGIVLREAKDTHDRRDPGGTKNVTNSKR